MNQVRAYISDELKEQVREYCFKHRITESALINQVLKRMFGGE